MNGTTTPWGHEPRNWFEQRARATIRRSVTTVGARADARLPRFRAALTRGLTIFLFHEVTDTPSDFQTASSGFTSLGVFRRQISWIADRFEIISPTALPQLGGSGALPDGAAVLTFDDAWAGVFRDAIPILDALGLPALCLVNMATVHGAPDLSAVRRFERLVPPPSGPRLTRRLDVARGHQILAEIDAYGSDPVFARFQGSTATLEDLDAVAGNGLTWFGSHLFHHWDLKTITPDLFDESLAENGRALARYPCSLPVLATPYGDPLPPGMTIPESSGIAVVFVASGGQNRDPAAPVLDRLALEPEPSGPFEWWYSAHRHRMFGSLPD